jgi:heme-degrading monooxygenase HmoA
MSGSGFAKTPQPPYYAVVFTSQRNGSGEADYSTAAEAMFELVRQQPGFLGAESARGADGFGITVAYFDSEENIRHWRNQAEHAATRERGKREWYDHFEVRVAKVERAYNGPKS